MTAQTDTLARAVRPTVTPTVPESPAAAHWNAYVAAHGPALRARARRNMAHTVLGLLAVAAVLLLAVGAFALLNPADAHALAGTGVLAIVGAFVRFSIMAARRGGD